MRIQSRVDLPYCSRTLCFAIENARQRTLHPIRTRRYLILAIFSPPFVVEVRTPQNDPSALLEKKKNIYLSKVRYKRRVHDSVERLRTKLHSFFFNVGNVCNYSKE